MGSCTTGPLARWGGEKRAWPRADRTLGCQAEYKGREEFSFFFKISKANFQMDFEFLYCI
jgi:hypothetical protein